VESFFTDIYTFRTQYVMCLRRNKFIKGSIFTYMLSEGEFF